MIAQGDAVRIPLPDQSIHCCVTSPPYWGLRKYAGDQGRIWGGDPECEHEWGDESTTTGPKKWDTATGQVYPDQTTERVVSHGQFCQLCSAWYGSLGLEPTPEQHVENIVEICREVRRVLRDDGVFWLNYGDCYSAAGWESNRRSVVGQGSFDPADRKSGKSPGTRAGSLMMMPHRVALALQQDGWIIRQDLVWFKRNPMPESVNGWRWQRERTKKGRSDHAKKHNIKGGTEAMLRDASIHKGIGPDWVPEYEYGDDLELRKGSWRHTRAHEYVFMLVKGMQYWSNQEAVREVANTEGDSRFERTDNTQIFGRDGDESRKRTGNPTAGRNPRSVLDVPTQPYRGAHYATFPVNLIAPLIRATCPRWACPVCGQGWAAVVEQAGPQGKEYWAGNWEHRGFDGTGKRAARDHKSYEGQSSVLGYRLTCEHDAPHDYFLSPAEHMSICIVCKRLKVDIEKDGGACSVPGIVFDPFLGSGTTVAVAQQLLRRGIGIDISMEYLDQQAKVRAGLGTPSNALDDLPLFQ